LVTPEPVALGVDGGAVSTEVGLKKGGTISGRVKAPSAWLESGPHAAQIRPADDATRARFPFGEVSAPIGSNGRFSHDALPEGTYDVRVDGAKPAVVEVRLGSPTSVELEVTGKGTKPKDGDAPDPKVEGAPLLVPPLEVVSRAGEFAKTDKGGYRFTVVLRNTRLRPVKRLRFEVHIFDAKGALLGRAKASGPATLKGRERATYRGVFRGDRVAAASGIGGKIFSDAGPLEFAPE
jgi:hypothetical protein